jgi:hypothetical protein
MHTPDLITPIAHVCNTYVAARQLPFKNTPMRQTMQQITDGVSALVAPMSPTLHADYGIGQGTWAHHPWVAVMDSRITTSVRHGMCVGMSWNEDMSGFAYGIFFGMEGLRALAGTGYDAQAIERLAFITHAAGIYADAFPATTMDHVYTRFSYSPHARWLGFYHPRSALPDNRTFIQTYMFTMMVYAAITPPWIERYGTI